MRRIENITVFTDRFKEARNSKTLECVAIESGISIGMIKHFSAGTKTPGIGHLKKLAAVLDVSPEWLAGDTPFKSSYEAWLACFNNPENKAAGDAERLIFQAIETLSNVHGYDLGKETEEGYNGYSIARFMAAAFTQELKNQCDLHLKKKEIPHPE